MKALVRGRDLPGSHILWGTDDASVDVPFILGRGRAQQLAGSQPFVGNVRVQLWSW